METIQKNLHEAFGASVKAARLRMNLTQDKLAEIIDVDRVTIQRIESGSSTSLDLAMRISEAVETPIEHLLPKSNSENYYLFHKSRANFFRVYLAFCKNGGGGGVIKSKNSCLAVSKHLRVHELVEQFYEKIEQDFSPYEAMKEQDELCGGLQDVFYIVEHWQRYDILEQLVLEAEEQAQNSRSKIGYYA